MVHQIVYSHTHTRVHHAAVHTRRLRLTNTQSHTVTALATCVSLPTLRSDYTRTTIIGTPDRAHFSAHSLTYRPALLYHHSALVEHSGTEDTPLHRSTTADPLYKEAYDHSWSVF
uniref:Uncharacterized protein n=1 Tax=Caenorhabditis japonica TaxID=281687 RepID=A0A8R1ECF4_CAEJA